MTLKRLQLLRAGRLIDGSGAEPLRDAAIVMEKGRIKSVGPFGQIQMREAQAMELVDASQYTVLPGLIDCHIHTALFNCVTFENARAAVSEISTELQQMYILFHAQMCLDMGITTIRDMGMTSSRGLLTGELCAVRNAINLGLFAGPRMLVAGWTVITGGHLDLVLPRAALRTGFQTADGPWELRKLARTNLRTGADFLKTCASGGGGTDQEEPDVRNMTQEELDAIVDEAHAFHKQCAVHCFTPESQRSALQAGADTIEHMVFTDDDAITRIKDSGTYVIPTLMHRTDHAIEMRRRVGGPEFVLKKMKAIQPHCFETFERMRSAGVKIAMGTDTSYDPEMGSSAGELALYVKYGMSPMEAIQTATKNAAEAIGLDKVVGTISDGMMADLIAIDGDPLTNIEVLSERKRIVMVLKAGETVVDRRAGKNVGAVQASLGNWKLA